NISITVACQILQKHLLHEIETGIYRNTYSIHTQGIEKCIEHNYYVASFARENKIHEATRTILSTNWGYLHVHFTSLRIQPGGNGMHMGLFFHVKWQYSLVHGYEMTGFLFFRSEPCLGGNVVRSDYMESAFLLVRFRLILVWDQIIHRGWNLLLHFSMTETLFSLDISENKGSGLNKLAIKNTIFFNKHIRTNGYYSLKLLKEIVRKFGDDTFFRYEHESVTLFSFRHHEFSMSDHMIKLTSYIFLQFPNFASMFFSSFLTNFIPIFILLIQHPIFFSRTRIDCCEGEIIEGEA
ncbi:hypothetical protein ACJX0J_008983, partial [Zea mays]